jgi:hypothetical protein
MEKEQSVELPSIAIDCSTKASSIVPQSFFATIHYIFHNTFLQYTPNFRTFAKQKNQK